MKRCVHWTNYCSGVLFLTSPLKVPFPGSTEVFFFLNTIVTPGSPENSAYSQKKLDPPLSMPPESYAESQHGWAKVSDLSLGCPDACRRQTGWQVPGQAALRHWAGLNLISKSQFTAIPNSLTVSIKNKGKGGKKLHPNSVAGYVHTYSCASFSEDSFRV